MTAAVDCRRKRNTHINIYSVYIYICIFGELPLYMHCAAYCLYGRGKSRITSVLAATQLGALEVEDGLRFERVKPTLSLPQGTTCSLKDAWTAAVICASFLSAF